LNGNAPIVFEDGRQSRDFVHVGDVAAAVRAALEPGAGDGQSLNVATGRRVTVAEIATTLAHALDTPIEPEVRNAFRAGDIRHCFGDPARAQAALGWSPQTPFADGMAELVEWLAGQRAVDRVDEATAALARRGLTA
jgi:dTDP-L-rhamnose 4-epimerase